MRSLSVRTALAAAAATVLAVGTAAPVLAHGDHGKDAERAAAARTAYKDGSSVPVLTSGNVRLAATVPDTTGISGCFLKTAPLFVMSSLDSISVYDVSDPVAPGIARPARNAYRYSRWVVLFAPPPAAASNGPNRSHPEFMPCHHRASPS